MRSGVLVAATAVVLVGASSASGFVDFRTPGKAAYCYVAAGEVNYTPNPALVCFTPNDGFTVTMRSGGRASKHYDRSNKWNYDYASLVLRYGRSWWVGDVPGDSQTFGTGTPDNTSQTGRILYRCWSRSTGLTCKNRAGHGWWLGRLKGYRLF